nr:hypothetical protein [Tanacetum cinerariifolium]
MVPLAFADTHNMVAYVSKSDASTATINKVNDVVKLQALINGKRVVVTKDVLRQTLHLDDVDGVDCLPNEEIFTKLARIVDDLSSHTNQYTSPELTQKVFANMHRVENEVEVPNAPTPPSPTTAPSPHPQDPITTPPQAQPATPQTIPPQEQPTNTFESSMALLTTLIKTCTTLSQKVTQLEQDKIAQALEIFKLKKSVKKLEKKRRSKCSGGCIQTGGEIEAIDADEDITLVDAKTQVNMDAELQRRIDDVSVAATKEVNAVEPVVFDDDEVTMTMAQTLIKMKDKKARLIDEQIAKMLHDEEVEQVVAKEKHEKDDLEKAKVLQQQVENEVEVPNAPTPPSPTTAPSPPPQDPITTPPQAQPATPQAIPPQEQPTNTFESSMTLLTTLIKTCTTFMVRNVDSPSKFLMYPQFLQVVLNAQVDDLYSYTTRYTSHALTQKVFANMRRVGKGFFGIKTPLFASMLVQPQPQAVEEEDNVEVPAAPTSPSLIKAPLPPPQDPIPKAQPATLPSPPHEQPTDTSKSSMTLINTLMETCTTLFQKVAQLEQDKIAQALEILKLKKRVKKLEKKRISKSFGLKRLRKALATINKVNDVVKLQALINGKRVVVTKDVLRQTLHLDDVDGVDCLPNEEIFTKLARIVDDLSSHTNQYTSPELTQKVFANMHRVENEVEVPNAPTPPSPTTAPSPHPQDPITTPPQAQPATPQTIPPQEQPTNTFESSMALLTTLIKTCTTLSQKDKIAQALEIFKLKKSVKKLEKKRRSKCSGGCIQTGGEIEAIDADEDITLVDAKTQVNMDAELQRRIDDTLIKMKDKKARLIDEQIAKMLHDEEVEQVVAKEKHEKDDLEKAKVLQQQYVDKQENID